MDKHLFEQDGIKLDFYFDDGVDGLVLCGGSGEADTLVIPDTVDGLEVKALDEGDLTVGGFERVIANDKYFSVIDGVLFNKDKTELLIYPPEKKDKRYQLPTGTELIGGGAFCNRYLEFVIIPEGVSMICQYAFACCKNLEEIVLPISLERVLLKAFYFCERLKSVLYGGTAADWSKIDFTLFNEALTSADIYYIDLWVCGGQEDKKCKQ